MDGARRVVGAIMLVMLLGLLDVLSAEAAWVDNQDGTISDTVTGLVWQQADDGEGRTWKEALAYCEGLNLAGRSDWRLPNIRELESIVDDSRFAPACDPVFQCRSNNYWSGSTYVEITGYAWYERFGDGSVRASHKSHHNNFFVRCVRSGPSGPFDPLTIAQTPMSGPPGTNFVQWGTGFTPNSTATLHFKKPDGTEYPTSRQELDAIGHFEIPYTAPWNKPPGTYTWWAVDDTTGHKSNEVSYVIEGVAGEIDHFAFGPLSDQWVEKPFSITIMARDYQGNLVSGFNGEVSLSLIGPGRIWPNKVQLKGGAGSVEVTIDEASQNTRLRAAWNEVLGESDPFAVLSSGAQTGSVVSWVAKASKNGKIPLSDATVKIAQDDLDNPVATTQSDGIGVFKFENLAPGRYFLWAVNGEYRSTTRAVEVSAGKRCHPEVLIVREGKRPVILVPGIMGTGERGHTPSRYPTLPGTMPADRDDLELHDPGDQIKGYAGAVGWEKIRDQLADDYEVYDCPYDWRVSLSNVRWSYEKYLLPVIKDAMDNSGWDKVDVVAHSMGGLLVRSYIQSGDYRGEIEKFAMVGTPNKGSLSVYRIQEGGDPAAADEAVGGGCPGAAPYFYSTVSDNIYRAMRGKRMFDFDKLGMGNCVKRKVESQRTVRDFIRAYVPTARQLMPVFPNCLYRNFEHFGIASSENVNTWLKNLNNDKSGLNKMKEKGGSVITKIFASTDVLTLAEIPVKESGDPGLYQDGEPIAHYFDRKDGDGTVLAEESARLPDVAFFPAEAGEHASLIKEFTGKIIEFLNEGRGSTARAMTESAVGLRATTGSAVLGVSLSGRAAPLLVAPGGGRCGVEDITQQSHEDLSGCTIVRGVKGGGVRVIDPVDGTYTVELSGDAAEDVAVTVSYLTENVALEKRFDLFYPGAPIAFTFAMDAAGNPSLQVASQPPEPENVQALAFETNDGQMTEIHWPAVADPSVSGYRIYSRRDDEPVLSFLAATPAAATRHVTAHPWNEPSRIYAVSVVTAAGKESFLSNYVENRPIIVADFSGTPVVGEAPLSVQFQDLTSGTALSWEWDFGDGSSGTDQHPAHTYGAAGTYTVRLKVVGEDGGQDTKIREAFVTVYEQPSAAFNGMPLSGSAPLNVQFTDASTGSITEWMWDFGDGVTSTEQHPNHTFVTAGTYSVTLTVVGPLGSDTETKNGFIEVSSAPDLSITVKDAPDPVVMGTDLTYTLQISNAGPAGATGVVVKDTLPSKVTFISAASSQGSCTRSLRKVTCKLGKVAAGGSAQIQIVVQPTKTGTVTNTASVVSNETDPDPTNNTATATTTVKRLPTVTLVATDPQATEAGRTRGQFTIYRKGGGTSVPLVVNYIVSGTATNGGDYITLSGTRTIPAGAVKATINVRPVNDKVDEEDETVVLTLMEDAVYVVGTPGSAVVAILDND